MSGLRPILKWPGGKRRLRIPLAQRVPVEYQRYFEPFFGGGALFFELRPRRALIADLNADLMNVYHSVALDHRSVIAHLQHHAEQNSEAHYYRVRDQWNDGVIQGGDIGRAAALLYMNRVGFNGLYRVNGKGAYNVPYGQYTDPFIFDASELFLASLYLKRADIVTGTFQHSLAQADRGDFVYIDPPYHGAFTDYTAGGFGEDSQRALASVVRELHRRGTLVMVSNSDTPLIHELYQGFRRDRVVAPRSISRDGGGREAIYELIITTYLP